MVLSSVVLAELEIILAFDFPDDLDPFKKPVDFSRTSIVFSAVRAEEFSINVSAFLINAVIFSVSEGLKGDSMGFASEKKDCRVHQLHPLLSVTKCKQTFHTVIYRYQI